MHRPQQRRGVACAVLCHLRDHASCGTSRARCFSLVPPHLPAPTPLRAGRQAPSVPLVDAFRDYGAEAAAAAASRLRQQQQWQQQLQQQRQGGMGDPFPALPSAVGDAGGAGHGPGTGPGSSVVQGGAGSDWQPVADETQRPSLSTLFQPPHDILFTGSFEQVSAQRH